MTESRVLPRSPLYAMVWSKARMARHTLASVSGESKLKVAFVSVSAVLLLWGIYGGSRLAFGLLETLGYEVLGGATLSLGDLVMARLLSTFALTVFVLLIFSNVLVAYATLFTSREMPFLVHSPLDVSTLFLGRFLECVSFSSWATAFLGAPVMLAYGVESGAPLGFYLALVAFYLPFVVIPAAIGAIIALLLVRSLTFLRQRATWLAVLAGLVLLTLFQVFRSRLRTPDFSDPTSLQTILDLLGRSQNPLLPSQWLARGVLASATGDLGEALFHLALLLVNAALALFIAVQVAESTFEGAWSDLLTTQQRKPPTRIKSHARQLGLLDRLLRPLPEPTRSLVTKDIKMFLREPSQWSQFVLFFGILAVYFANLGGKEPSAFDAETWQAWGTLLNLGASMLILASLTTRFVYPMISLEGRRIWILGMSPVTLRRVVWQKFWLSVVATSIFTVSLSVLSALKLQLDAVELALSVAAVAAATLGLSGLAVGLGSLYPNFEDDNPSRIVSGLGGTLNFILSMVYVVFIAAPLGVVLLWHRLSEVLGVDRFSWVVALVAAWIVGLTLVASWLPLHLGIRHLESLEM